MADDLKSCKDMSLLGANYSARKPTGGEAGLAPIFHQLVGGTDLAGIILRERFVLLATGFLAGKATTLAAGHFVGSVLFDTARR